MLAIRSVDGAQAGSLNGMPELLIDVVDGGASVGFLAPLDFETAAGYWQTVYSTLGDALRLWIAESEGQVVGTVQLTPSMKQNGRHRAEIQKLLVLRAWRGRGVAARLLAAAEAYAKADGRTLLVLDTEAASVGEAAYRRLGWLDAGGIPDYAASTHGELRANRIFYKRL